MPFAIDPQGRFKLPYRILISLLHGSIAALIGALIATAQLESQHPPISTASILVLGLVVAAIFWLLTSWTAVGGEGRVRNGWKVLGFVYVFVALVVLVNVISKGLLHAHHVNELVNVLLSTVMGLAAAWICLAIEKKPLASIGYRLNGRWAGDLGLGVLGGAGVMLITALIALGAGGFHWTKGAADFQAIAWGLLLFILVGFNEETLFRGYLFQRLVDGIGEWPAQILMALFFGLSHWGNPGMHGATLAWATLNIALAAILLGLCYLKTKSLALPIGVHIGWNFTQGNLLGFGVSGTTDAKGLLTPVFHAKPEWLTGGAFGLEASLPCVIICGAAIVALVLWKGRVSAGSSTAPAS